MMPDINSIILYYQNLLIIQYHNLPKAQQTIYAYIQMIWASGILFAIQQAFNIETAIGVQLDTLGKYIGTDRYFNGQTLTGYFSLLPYGTSPAVGQVGFTTQALFPSETNPTLIYADILSTAQALNDDSYRQILKFKIINNSSNFSHASIDNNLFAFFGNGIRAEMLGTMSMAYFVTRQYTQIALAALQKGILPKPMGVGIGFVIEEDVPYFGMAAYQDAFVQGVPWDIYTAGYRNKNYDPSTQITHNGIMGMAWNIAGTKLYLGDYNTNKIYEYSASTPYDVTTLTYTTKSLDTTSQVASIGTQGLAGHVISTDGTKLFVLSIAHGAVYQYNLGTAFDLSTATYSSLSFSTTTQTVNPLKMYLRADGAKMFIGDNNTNKTFQYTLATPNNISTAVYDGKLYDTSSQVTLADGIFFKSDGTKFYNGDFASGKFYQYTLSKAWDISTATYDSKFLDASALLDSETQDISFSLDGSLVYVDNINDNIIYQFDMIEGTYKTGSDTLQPLNPFNTGFTTQSGYGTSIGQTLNYADLLTG